MSAEPSNGKTIALEKSVCVSVHRLCYIHDFDYADNGRNCGSDDSGNDEDKGIISVLVLIVMIVVINDKNLRMTQ